MQQIRLKLEQVSQESKSIKKNHKEKIKALKQKLAGVKNYESPEE